MNKPPRVDPRVEPSEAETRRAVSAVPDWAHEILSHLREGFERVESRQARHERTIHDLATEVMQQGSRIARLESDRERQSIRVREVDERSSSNDLAHEATIAMIQSDVRAVNAKVDTVLLDVASLAGGINRIVASPKAKMFASAVVAWLLGYLASKGVSIPALQ